MHDLGKHLFEELEAAGFLNFSVGWDALTDSAKQRFAWIADGVVEEAKLWAERRHEHE